MGYWMASSGDDSDSSSEYFSAQQSPSVSATPQTPAAPASPAATAADEFFSPMPSPSVPEHVSPMQSPSVPATPQIPAPPQSPAAPATSAAAASPSVSEYFWPMQSPSVPAPPQITAPPQSPAAPATPAAATAVGATIETEIPLFTLLVAVLGVILTLYVSSGHPRRGVRYSAYAVTGLLCLTLVLLAMGGWFGRPELIRAGRNLAWVVLAGAIVFALFVYYTS